MKPVGDPSASGARCGEMQTFIDYGMVSEYFRMPMKSDVYRFD